MDRREIVNAFAEVRGDAIVITGPGISSGMLWEAHAHPATIYNMDLAYSGPMAMGIALGAPAAAGRLARRRRLALRRGRELGTYARYPLPNLDAAHACERDLGDGRRQRRDDGRAASVERAGDRQRLESRRRWSPRRTSARSRRRLRTALREPGPWFVCAVDVAFDRGRLDGRRRKTPSPAARDRRHRAVGRCDARVPAGGGPLKRKGRTSRPAFLLDGAPSGSVSASDLRRGPNRAACGANAPGPNVRARGERM